MGHQQIIDRFWIKSEIFVITFFFTTLKHTAVYKYARTAIEFEKVT